MTRATPYGLVPPCQPRPPSPLQQPPPPGSKLPGRPSPTSCSSRHRDDHHLAESLISSLRQRTETTDLTDITRAFGTSDIALILERLTTGLQRLRALEDKVRRAVAGLDTDPQLESTSAPSSPLSLCASQPLGLTPEYISVLSLLAPELMAIAPVRATGPPSPRLSPQNPTGPVHPLTPRGMDGPAVPIPPRGAG